LWEIASSKVKYENFDLRLLVQSLAICHQIFNHGFKKINKAPSFKAITNCSDHVHNGRTPLKSVDHALASVESLLHKIIITFNKAMGSYLEQIISSFCRGKRKGPEKRSICYLQIVIWFFVLPDENKNFSNYFFSLTKEML